MSAPAPAAAAAPDQHSPFTATILAFLLQQSQAEAEQWTARNAQIERDMLMHLHAAATVEQALRQTIAELMQTNEQLRRQLRSVPTSEWVTTTSELAAQRSALPCDARHPLAAIDAAFQLSADPALMARAKQLADNPGVPSHQLPQQFNIVRPFLYSRASTGDPGTCPRQFDTELGSSPSFNAGEPARNAEGNRARAAGAPAIPPLPVLPIDARIAAGAAFPLVHPALRSPAAHAAREYGDGACPVAAGAGTPLGPEFLLMCAALRPGDTVLCCSVSRIHHDRSELDVVWAFFARWGIRLIALIDAIDSGLCFINYGGQSRPRDNFYFHAGMTCMHSLARGAANAYDGARSKYAPDLNWLLPPAFWAAVAGDPRWLV